MHRSIALGAVAAFALVAACSKPAADNAAATAGAAADNTATAAGAVVDKAQDATAAAVGVASASMPTDAGGFVNAAAMSDMYEIAAAKIAVEKANSAKVKAFAKTMIHDHTATTDAVKAILAKGSVSASPPADLDQRRKGLLDNLNSAPAGGFDKVYLDQQVAAHDEAETLMKNYGEHGDNADLKAFAAKTAPKVQSHLDMAKSLDEAIDKAPG